MAKQKVVNAKSVKMSPKSTPRIGARELDVTCGNCGKAFEAKNVPVIPNATADCPHCYVTNRV